MDQLLTTEELAKRLRESNRTLLLCGAREQPAALMHASHFDEHVGKRNMLPNIEAALARAREAYGPAAA